MDGLDLKIGPEVLLAVDGVLLILLAGAVGVGLNVRRKLGRLRAEREEWARAMTAFAASTEAAQATLADWKATLVAEDAERNSKVADLETALAKAASAKALTPAPPPPSVKPAPAVQEPPPKAPTGASILSMQ